MSYSYGSSASTAPINAPKCWGTGYDNESRHCMNCSVKGSCRDQVVRSSNQRTTLPQVAPVPMPAPSYYPTTPPAQSLVPAPAPVQIQRAPLPAPTPRPYVPSAPVPQAVPQPQQVAMAPAAPPQAPPQPFQLPPNYGMYGWLQDPLYQTMEGSPPPFRPQMTDESFIQRVLKNMILVGIEAVAKQFVVAIRQAVWAPRHPTLP